MSTPPPLRQAVIDLGTNTFHLLIADLSATGISTVYRERIFVKLAEDGIEKIGPAALRRATEGLTHFAKILKEYNCTDPFAFGTAALRTASNGHAIVDHARSIGITVRIIPGDEEARLITRGVLGALPALTERALIMDIGGGSTEFILADQSGVHWRQSFPLGVLVLFNAFHQSDPIAADEAEALREHLRKELLPLSDALAEFPTHHLVGAAGTFDVLVDMFAQRDAAVASSPHAHRLMVEKLRPFFTEMRTTTLSERLEFPGLPPQRAELMSVAAILIEFILELAGIQRVSVSEYAMKEGILLEAYAEYLDKL